LLEAPIFSSTLPAPVSFALILTSDALCEAILFLVVSLLALAPYSNLPVRTNFDADQATTSRAFAFTSQAHVPAIKDANGKFPLWLPLPEQDEYPSVRDLQIESAVAPS
jgi:hypothetical protein